MSDAARPVSDPSPGHSLGTVERAYQLARSGRFTRLEDLRRALMHEGYEAVQQHVSGPSIRRDLTRLCRETRGGAREPEPAR